MVIVFGLCFANVRIKSDKQKNVTKLSAEKRFCKKA